MTTTHMLETAEVDIAYNVHGPLPTADGRPPLFMIGQPMDASGFATSWLRRSRGSPVHVIGEVTANVQRFDLHGAAGVGLGAGSAEAPRVT